MPQGLMGGLPRGAAGYSSLQAFPRQEDAPLAFWGAPPGACTAVAARGRGGKATMVSGEHDHAQCSAAHYAPQSVPDWP